MADFIAVALELPTGTTFGEAFDVNNADQACGEVDSHAVRWDGPLLPGQSTAHYLDDGGALGSIAYAMSDDGFCVGEIVTSLTDSEAVIWAPDGTINSVLGYVSGGDAYATGRAINDSRHVAGWEASDSLTNPVTGVRWTPTGAFLSPLGGDASSNGYGINNLSDVCGTSGPLSTGTTTAVWWPGGSTTPTALDLGGGTFAVARDINETQDLVGQYLFHIACAWPAGGAVTSLGTIAGSASFGGTGDSYAYAISDTGHVAGAGADADDLYRAIYWDAIGSEALGLPFLEGGSDAWGYGNNEAGWVSGYCDATDGNYYATIWRPIAPSLAWWGVLLLTAADAAGLSGTGGPDSESGTDPTSGGETYLHLIG